MCEMCMCGRVNMILFFIGGQEYFIILMPVVYYQNTLGID